MCAKPVETPAYGGSLMPAVHVEKDRASHETDYLYFIDIGQRDLVDCNDRALALISY
jgi:hypothetical protein